MIQALKAREQMRLVAASPAAIAGACAIGLLFVVAYVLLSGTWLDEYWQLWVSGAPTGLIVQRFGPDAHPPLFNLVARGIISVTGANLIWARLVNLGLAIAALALGLRSLTSLDPPVRWRIFLLVSASAGLVGMTHLASSFRVYPWVLVMATLQGTVLLCVAERRSISAPLAICVTLISIVLQYVHAAGAIVIGMVSVAVAWRNKDRRATAIILCGVLAGALIDLATGLMQLPFWRSTYDVNWIGQSGSSPWQAIEEALGSYFVFNLAATGLIAFAIIRGKWRRLLVIQAPVPIALAVWLVMGSVQPLLVPRYIASVTGLFSVAAAVGWTDLELRNPYNGIVALLAAFQPYLYTFDAPPRPGFEEGARLSASVTHQCPSSKLYAIPAWRFRDQPNSRTARFETPVMGFGYTSVGHRFGLTPKIVTAPVAVHLQECPAIIWMEAGHGIDKVPVATVLRRAQLEIDAPFTAHFEPTENGAVLLISRSNRLGRSQ